MVIPSHMKRHLYYQEIATPPAQLHRFDKPFVALLVLPPLIIFPAHVDYSLSHHLYPFPLLFHPSFIPLVFPSPSIPAPLIPTGVVIPSPQRRLNDFILPCLCLLLLMMCLVPSYFDVDYHSLLVYVCVCQEWRRRNSV